jgi:hypothetical protein
MNWGNKILIVFLAFASLISYMVYRCTQVQVNLVTDEYYKDELAYQQIIDESKNAKGMRSKFRIEQGHQNLTIEFPTEFQKSNTSGEIIFYCPSDASKDLKWKIELDEKGQQTFELSRFRPGQYTAKIRWASGSVRYYQEEPINISNK